MPTRLQIAKPHIVKHFDELGRRVFGTKDLAAVLSVNRQGWRLAKQTSTAAFIDYLCAKSKLHRHELPSPYGDLQRYSWGEASAYELALSIRRGAYLSHGTALLIHGLTDQVPETIYVNKEQSPKPRTGLQRLSQGAIDSSFARPQRQSKYVYTLGDKSIVLVNGKSTGDLEVGEATGPAGETPLRVTKIERTLIDVTVRPAYAGGVYQVLEAYKAARGRISSNVLVATLKRLDYVYPYHQAIGFYLERAGYPEKYLEPLRRIGFEFDFYLGHALGPTEYSSSWRLFHPEGL